MTEKLHYIFTHVQRDLLLILKIARSKKGFQNLKLVLEIMNFCTFYENVGVEHVYIMSTIHYNM